MLRDETMKDFIAFYQFSILAPAKMINYSVACVELTLGGLFSYLGVMSVGSHNIRCWGRYRKNLDAYLLQLL